MMFKSPSPVNLNLCRLDNTKIYEIRFRVSGWMKEDFAIHCQSQDVPASHLLRQAIREILKKSGEN